MFDLYGCFIINDKKGSLKFYNGSGFNNQYSSTHFSNKNRSLLGVDFKQQTIAFKVGLYWFTIEEYQQFLNDISPYNINYITFGYADQYGYLVKLGKIADSVRYVIGKNKQGQPVYYTELDLTWEVLGDSGARSNSPYEYSRVGNQSNDKQFVWSFNATQSDMSDKSLLDTPVLFEVPFNFFAERCNISLSAFYGESIDEAEHLVSLFDVSLKNLSINPRIVPGKYYLNTSQLSDSKLNYNKFGIFRSNNASIFSDECMMKENPVENETYSISWDTVNNAQCLKIVFFKPILSAEFEFPDLQLSWGMNNKGEIHYDQQTDLKCTFDDYDNTFLMFGSALEDIKGDSFGINFNVQLFTYLTNSLLKDSAKSVKISYNNSNYGYLIKATTPKTKKIGCILFSNNTQNGTKSFLSQSAFLTNEEQFTIPELVTNLDLKKALVISSLDTEAALSELVNEYQMFLRYDSETGLIFLQLGSDDSWRLLNYQTDNYQGDYLLESASIQKWKIPGVFSAPNLDSTQWKFQLVVNSANLFSIPVFVLENGLTVYSRKNIV